MASLSYAAIIRTSTDAADASKGSDPFEDR